MNILENINLDQVEYGVTTNTGEVPLTDSYSVQLSLNPERLMLLNPIQTFDGNRPANSKVKGDVSCNPAYCNPKRTDICPIINSRNKQCIDGTRNSRNICVA